jgi:hypothetical protein
MAECLSPEAVNANDFISISLKTEEHAAMVRKLVKSANISVHVNVAPHMLVTIKEND